MWKLAWKTSSCLLHRHTIFWKLPSIGRTYNKKWKRVPATCWENKKKIIQILFHMIFPSKSPDCLTQASFYSIKMKCQGCLFWIPQASVSSAKSSNVWMLWIERALFSLVLKSIGRAMHFLFYFGFKMNEQRSFSHWRESWPTHTFISIYTFGVCTTAYFKLFHIDLVPAPIYSIA